MHLSLIALASCRPQDRARATPWKEEYVHAVETQYILNVWASVLATTHDNVEFADPPDSPLHVPDGDDDELEKDEAT